MIIRNLLIVMALFWFSGCKTMDTVSGAIETGKGLLGRDEEKVTLDEVYGNEPEPEPQTNVVYVEKPVEPQVVYVEKPAEPKVVYVERPSTTVIYEDDPEIRVRRRSVDIEIDEYDEYALDDYISGLKNVVSFIQTIPAYDIYAASPQYGKYGLMMAAALGLSKNQMDAARIELGFWPPEAKEKAWDAYGKRIIQYNKLVDENRNRVLADDRYSEDVHNYLRSITLLTKETLFAEQ